MHQLFTFPAEELKQKDTVYLTIALELHVSTIANDKDRIKLENLLSQAENELKESDVKEKEALFKQLDAVMLHLTELVNHTGGLAIYITPEEFYYYHLAIPVADQTFIGDKPYILPLAENYQYTQDFHLLVLNRESARIFEGHGRYIRELDMTEIDEEAPINIEVALGTEKEGGDLNFGAYGGASGQSGGGGQYFHGHSETSAEKDIDRERFFRLVDDFVFENYSNKTHWPLVLFTVEDNHGVFRSITSNNYLSDLEIVGSAANMKINEIEKIVGEKVTHLIKTQREESLRGLEEVTLDNRIENIPDDLTSASLQGQIGMLYVEKGFEIPGSITEEGLYDRDDDRNNFVEMLVNNVINTGGKVFVFETEEMPESSQIIARLRF